MLLGVPNLTKNVSVNIKKMILMWVRVANMLCECLLVPIPSLRAFTIAAFRWEIPLNQQKNTTGKMYLTYDKYSEVFRENFSK